MTKSLSKKKKKKLLKKQQEEERLTYKAILSSGFETGDLSQFDKPSSLPTVEEVLKGTPKYVVFRVKRDIAIETEPANKRSSQSKAFMIPAGEYCSTLSFFLDLYKHDKGYTFELSKFTFKDRYKKYTGQDLNGKSVLICRMGGLGDVIVSQVVVNYLEHKYPNCQIVYATSESSAYIINKFWPKGLISKVVTIPFRAEVLDLCDYHIYFEGLIERSKNSGKFYVHDLFLRACYPDPPLSLSEIRKYLPVMYVDEGLVKKVGEQLPLNLIGIHPFASAVTRSMSIDLICEIIKVGMDLGFNVGFICDPRNSEECSTKDIVFYRLKDYKSVGALLDLSMFCRSFDEYFAVLKNLRFLFAADSSSAHFSGALGIPTCVVGTSFSAEGTFYALPTHVWYNSYENWHGCGQNPCRFFASFFRFCPYLKDNLVPGCTTTKAIDVMTMYERILKLRECFDENDKTKLEKVLEERVAEFPVPSIYGLEESSNTEPNQNKKI